MSEIITSSVPLYSYVRVIHSFPLRINVDVYANKNLIASNVAFGDISKYISLPHGEYEIQVFKASTTDTPLYSTMIYLYPKTYTTLSILSLDENISILPIKDSAPISQDSPYSFVRFMNLSKNAPLLNLSLFPSETLFSSVEYAETTGYAPLSPGIYTFRVEFSTAKGIYKYLTETQITPGQFYTIYIVGLYKDDPELGYIFITDGM